MAHRARRGWPAVLAVALLAGACSASASVTTTVPPGESALEQQVADQLAQIQQLQADASALTAELEEVRSELTRAGSREEDLARALEEARQREAALLGTQQNIWDWANEEINRYHSQLEQLRPQVPLPDTAEARRSLQALEAFLIALQDGDYATAAGLCCGDWETLIYWNSNVDPADEPALLQSACEHQLVCDLTVRRILAGSVGLDRYEFYVEFETDDGQLFTSGPRGGGEAGPISSQFPFVVIQTPEGPQVLDPQALYMG